MRVVWVGMVLLASLACAHAVPERAFVFDGELYARAYDDGLGPAERFVEFTRSGETVESWRKLFVVHWFPRETGTPTDVAKRLATLAQARSGAADARLAEERGEALVHFLATSSDNGMVEVDAFKYAPAADGRGMVAVQFALRFAPGEMTPTLLKAARQHAVAEIRAFDLGQVRSYFQPTL